MNNPRATGRYVQTAFLQAEGELCLKARPSAKTPPRGLLDPNYKALAKIPSLFPGLHA
jgi:hypothetical protein